MSLEKTVPTGDNISIKIMLSLAVHKISQSATKFMPNYFTFEQ